MKLSAVHTATCAEVLNANFIRMLDEIGGMEQYERRLRWWQASRETFVRAFNSTDSRHHGCGSA